MKVVFAAVVLLALCSTVHPLRFSQLDLLGNEVQRVLNLVKSPANGFTDVFQVVSELQNAAGLGTDVIEFLFGTAWAPRQVLHYIVGGNGTSLTNLFNARWTLWKIIEYQNVDDLLEFNPTIDNVVSQFSLFGRGWSPLSLNQETVNGVQYYSLCTQLNDNIPRPEVKICVRLAASRIQSLRLDPNAIEFSIDIANYSFQGQGTKLALKTSFNSNSLVQDLLGSLGGVGLTELNDVTESALEIASTVQNTATRVLASWSKITSLTGGLCAQAGSVLRSPIFVGQVLSEFDVLPILDPDTLLDPIQKVTYFSFITDSVCQPVSISWDPEFGVATPSPAAGTNENGVSVVVPSLVLLFLALLQLFL